jgi:hypothetical protein
MNTMNKITLSILIAIGCILRTNSQNPDSLPSAQRDSMLISIAKEVVLKYGPDYYREYKKPVITQRNVDGGKGIGRIIYMVTFLYDKTKEELDLDFAALVSIWGDSGKPHAVRFGNSIDGFFRYVREDYLQSNAAIEQTPYQQKYVFPIYDLSRPENKTPKNIDELRKRGYEERENGQWVKVTKDVPPRY